MADSIQFSFKNVKKWREALRKDAFREALRRNVHRATMINAKRASALQRRIIQSSEGIQKNAKLTIALKGVDKPLVGDSTLFGAITEVAGSADSDISEAFSGVKRTEGRYNIAVTVHDGAAISVTPKMRGMFYYLWMASEALRKGEGMPELSGRAQTLFAKYKDWHQLGPATTAIVIPSRPWSQIAFSSPDLKAEATKNWAEAIRRTFKERVGT